MAKFNTASIQSFLGDVFDLMYFTGESKVLDVEYTPGDGKLVLVSGDNATGKSFLRKLTMYACRQEKIEPLYTSQACRTEGGMKNVFVYGLEGEESTGVISVKALTGAMSTSKNRDNPHAIYLDEPEIGLSDSYSAGCGQLVRNYITSPPEHLFALFISSHSKAFVSQLSDLNPHHIRLGGAPDLQTWLTNPVVPKDPTELQDLSRKRFGKIEDILRKVRKRSS